MAGATVTAPTALPDAATFDPDANDDAYQAALDQLAEEWEPVEDGQADDLADQVTAAVEAGDPAMLAEVEPDTTDAAEVLAAALLALLLVAAALAVVEALGQGVTVPGIDLDDDTRDRWGRGDLDDDDRALLTGLFLTDAGAAWLDGSATATAARLGRALANTVTEAALRLWRDDDPAATVAAVRAELADRASTWLRSMLGAALHAALTAARHAVFTLTPDPTWTASEVLDRNTCGPCEEIDGTEFADLDAALAAYPTGPYVLCEGRWRCRGLLLPVWT